MTYEYLALPSFAAYCIHSRVFLIAYTTYNGLVWLTVATTPVHFTLGFVGWDQFPVANALARPFVIIEPSV